jgi:ketosteroid isomerase-like protein
MSTTTTDTMSTIRTATEARDADALIALYADDAQVTVVDSARPPSSPTTLRGRGEIADFVRQTTDSDMTHQVRDEVRGDDRLAYTVHCRYPNGARVLCATIADLDGAGHITNQTIVQAWDE